MEGECNLILGDDEDIARCAIFPKILVGNVFSIEAVISPLDKASYGCALSVGRRSMLPLENDVHLYGCRVAEIKRRGKEARLTSQGKPFRRPGDSDHYRGYYDLRTGSVLQIKDEITAYDVAVVPCPEEGQDEHCEIRLYENENKTKKQRSFDRTKFVSELLKLLRNPREYICECDSDLREMLEIVKLTDPCRDV